MSERYGIMLFRLLELGQHTGECRFLAAWCAPGPGEGEAFGLSRTRPVVMSAQQAIDDAVLIKLLMMEDAS